MAGIRQGIIKKDKVDASGARSADETLLGTALRFRKEHVVIEPAAGEEAAPGASSPLLRRHMAATSDRSVEIRTRHIEHVQRPKMRSSERAGKAPEQTPEEIEAAWNARIEEARQSAFAEGLEAGRTAAKTEFDIQVADLKSEFAQDLDALQKSWETFLHRHEPQLVQLAFRLSRTVLDAPLPDDVRQISERVVADAVERMASDVAVEIILHPVSYLRIQENGIEDQLNAIHSKLRWRINPDLKQNEWIVQSSRAATRRIEDELIDQLQRELAQRGEGRVDGLTEGRVDGLTEGRVDGLTEGRVDGLTGPESDGAGADAVVDDVEADAEGGDDEIRSELRADGEDGSPASTSASSLDESTE